MVTTNHKYEDLKWNPIETAPRNHIVYVEIENPNVGYDWFEEECSYPIEGHPEVGVAILSTFDGILYPLSRHDEGPVWSLLEDDGPIDYDYPYLPTRWAFIPDDK